jgi:hypothetical protein
VEASGQFYLAGERIGFSTLGSLLMYFDLVGRFTQD